MSSISKSWPSQQRPQGGDGCAQRGATADWLHPRGRHRPGAKKDYPVIADETIVLWDAISISAGQRGLQIIIAPGRLPARDQKQP